MLLFKEFDDFSNHLKPVHGRLAFLDGVVVLDAGAVHFLNKTYRGIFGILVEVFLCFHLESSFIRQIVATSSKLSKQHISILLYLSQLKTWIIFSFQLARLLRLFRFAALPPTWIVIINDVHSLR